MARIAIVGGGISGLTCAWLLSRNHEITLFEANDYLGGHTHTHMIAAEGREWPVDTGFIVYNNKTYPRFIELLNELGIQGRPTEMSFSVASTADDIEYNGTSLNALFAQRRNLIRPKFWRMIRGIVRFNDECRKLLRNPPTDETLGTFLERLKFPSELGDFYIKPMAGAVWSAGTGSITSMPIHFLARFFENHGFLNINDRPQWYTVAGGSNAYVQVIQKKLAGKIQLKSQVTAVKRSESGAVVTCRDGQSSEFDHVILACHSDDALNLLSDPTREEADILGAIRYTRNDVTLHTDLKLMPKRKLAWAAWNYNLFDKASDDVAVTYSMNILQGHACETQFLVSLNCEAQIDPGKIIKRLQYRHPVFTGDAVRAQGRHGEISGQGRTHYCGAYWANGFHEDGVVSALRVVSMIDPSIRITSNSAIASR